MSCIICMRGNCCSSFHSIEEQDAFSSADEAYEKYLEVRAECLRKLHELEEECNEE